ncbi:MAG TPA: hypothetical protein VIF09_17540 [Polyangiaceae bacterium]|jgi:hypothetical protein
MKMRTMGFTAAVCVTAACHSPGPYGHSPRYVELSEETAAVAGAREYDPVMVQRQPDQWKNARVMLIGVVESRSAGPGAQAMLKLSVRRLEARNLCVSEQDDDSCRVTVSDKDFGTVYALVQVKGDDDIGPHAVGQRSLLRIVGNVGQDVSPTDGAPIIRASFYRHWPPFTYVTRASARDMRQ